MRPTQPLGPPLRNAQQQHSAANNPVEPTDHPQSERCRFRIFHRHEAETAQPEPTEAQQRQAEQDFWARTLRKQRNLNIATILGVLAAGAAFLVLLCTLHESDRVVRISERPYVDIAPASGNGTGPVAEWMSQDGIEVGLFAYFKNAGKTPARHLIVFGRLANIGGRPIQHLNMHPRYGESWTTGDTIPAGDTARVRISEVTASDVRAAFATLGKDRDEIEIGGTFEYTNIFNEYCCEAFSITWHRKIGQFTVDRAGSTGTFMACPSDVANVCLDLSQTPSNR